MKDTRYNSEGDLEALVVWTSLQEHEQSWERAKDLSQKFPNYMLKGKISSSEVGIDKPLKMYIRRKKY